VKTHVIFVQAASALTCIKDASGDAAVGTANGREHTTQANLRHENEVLSSTKHETCHFGPLSFHAFEIDFQPIQNPEGERHPTNTDVLPSPDFAPLSPDFA
jgi:hypothetical protein